MVCNILFVCLFFMSSYNVIGPRGSDALSLIQQQGENDVHELYTACDMVCVYANVTYCDVVSPSSWTYIKY